MAVTIRRLLLAAVVVAALFTPARAQVQRETYHAILTVDAATARVIAVGSWCSGSACANAAGDVTTSDLYITTLQAICWYADGSAPVATCGTDGNGHALGANGTLAIRGHTNIVNWKVISQSGNAIVTVSIARP